MWATRQGGGKNGGTKKNPVRGGKDFTLLRVSALVQ
jgi:hypothetical protein